VGLRSTFCLLTAQLIAAQAHHQNSIILILYFFSNQTLTLIKQTLNMTTNGIIFFGPPGSGKGTQASVLAEHLQVPHISTGEILRAAISNKTPLGEKAQGFVDRGDLVPDELILNLIRERLQLSDAEKGWILDGFPRNLSQASFLDQLLTQLGQAIQCVVNLEVPDESLVERLLQRGRQDDTQETISNRLKVYHQQSAPVIGYYRDRGTLYSVDGNRTPELVTQYLVELVQTTLPPVEVV